MRIPLTGDIFHIENILKQVTREASRQIAEALLSRKVILHAVEVPEPKGGDTVSVPVCNRSTEVLVTLNQSVRAETSLMRKYSTTDLQAIHGLMQAAYNSLIEQVLIIAAWPPPGPGESRVVCSAEGDLPFEGSGAYGAHGNAKGFVVRGIALYSQATLRSTLTLASTFGVGIYRNGSL